MKTQITIKSSSETATKQIGEFIGQNIEAGTAIGLVGDLGTGKTRLTQGIAAGLGVTGEVVSPTFVLCQQYPGRLLLVHVDAYRIKSDNEFLDLGTDEWVDDGAVLIVEWADRIHECLPDELVSIDIEISSAESPCDSSTASPFDCREITISAGGESGQELVRLVEDWYSPS